MALLNAPLWDTDGDMVLTDKYGYSKSVHSALLQATEYDLTSTEYGDGELELVLRAIYGNFNGVAREKFLIMIPLADKFKSRDMAVNIGHGIGRYFNTLVLGHMEYIQKYMEGIKLPYDPSYDSHLLLNNICRLLETNSDKLYNYYNTILTVIVKYYYNQIIPTVTLTILDNIFYIMIREKIYYSLDQDVIHAYILASVMRWITDPGSKRNLAKLNYYMKNIPNYIPLFKKIYPAVAIYATKLTHTGIPLSGYNLLPSLNDKRVIEFNGYLELLEFPMLLDITGSGDIRLIIGKRTAYAVRSLQDGSITTMATAFTIINDKSIIYIINSKKGGETIAPKIDTSIENVLKKV